MIFCSACFKDKQIQSIIQSLDQKGQCPICGEKDVFLYDSSINDSLNDFFNDLIMIYTPSTLLPEGYPISETHMLADELSREWNIFSDSLTSSNIYDIVKELSKNLYDDYPFWFDTPIGIPERYDDKYLKEHSILREYKWENFVEEIKHSNRFHTSIINTEKLSTYISYLKKDYPKGTCFYRGRLCGNHPFNKQEMGAPPSEFAQEGRANSRGISRLYLADSVGTCINEIRAGAFDLVSIGKFKLQKNISVVDLKKISSFSPFNENFDFLEYLINKPVLHKIDLEMGKAVRANDNHLDYIPTQYLCDFVKTLYYSTDEQFSGVEYSSTLNLSGYNLAIFYPELFKCTQVTTYSINRINYDYDNA